MSREIESDEESVIRIKRLKNPSLEDLRRFEVGKFFENSERIKGDKEIKSIRKIKTLVHPKWFEEKETTNPEKWSISKKVHQLIDNDKKASRRWRINKKWVKKKDSTTGEGHWVKIIRSPKRKYWKTVRYSELTKEQKGLPGRKPGGMAYKIRREIWKLFASPGLVLNLLKDEDLSYIERGPIFKTGKSNGKSVPTPHLETALREMIERDIWPELGTHKSRIAKEWCEHPNVKRFLDSKKRKSFIEGALEPEKEMKVINLICEKSWRVIIVKWLELKIHSENLIADRDSMYSIYTKYYSTSESDTETPQSIIIQKDRCDCLYWLRLQDEKDIWCGHCGLVIGPIFSTGEEEAKRKYD